MRNLLNTLNRSFRSLISGGGAECLSLPLPIPVEARFDRAG